MSWLLNWSGGDIRWTSSNGFHVRFPKLATGLDVLAGVGLTAGATKVTHTLLSGGSQDEVAKELTSLKEEAAEVQADRRSDRE